MDGYDISELNVTGYDAPVPNEYWTAGSDTLMVVLPGLGYTNQMPLMFYMQELAMNRRWDILQVNYDYRGMMGTAQEERVQRIAVDCRAVLESARAKGGHRRIVLTGKSLGTIAMTTLLEGDITQELTALWLTPIIRWPEVREAMSATAARSAVVIGTQDEHYEPEFLSELEAMGAAIEVVKGGDHSLDIEGDVVASVSVMRKVVAALDRFLDR